MFSESIVCHHDNVTGEGQGGTSGSDSRSGPEEWAKGAVREPRGSEAAVQLRWQAPTLTNIDGEGKYAENIQQGKDRYKMEKFTTEGMYIITALHEIPILAKRIEKQKEEIRKYASNMVGCIDFSSVEEQKKAVKSLVQSTIALVERMRWLKKCVAFTNAVSKINIDGYTYSVTELIAIKNELKSSNAFIKKYQSGETDPSRDLICSVYDCLNSQHAIEMLQRIGRDKDKDGSIVLFYDEGVKNREYEKRYEFSTKITSELEIFNARTKLLDPDDYEINPKQ